MATNTAARGEHLRNTDAPCGITKSRGLWKYSEYFFSTKILKEIYFAQMWKVNLDKKFDVPVVSEIVNSSRLTKAHH